MKNKQLNTIAVWVENRAGVLVRVAGLFSSRGFNIQSLTVGETVDPTISRMTIVVEGDERIIDQVKKQLNKLIDVIKVVDLTDKEYIERELVLIKVKAPLKERAEVFQIADVFRARIVDISHETLTIETTGTTRKVNAMLELLKPFGIKEIARTGASAIIRG